MSGCRKEWEVFGWSRSRISNNTRSRIFCPTPGVQLNQFLHHTRKLGNPVEMVQFLLKFLLKQNHCCVPHFHWLPVVAKLLTVKLHSRMIRSRSRTFYSLTSQPCCRLPLAYQNDRRRLLLPPSVKVWWSWSDLCLNSVVDYPKLV